MKKQNRIKIVLIVVASLLLTLVITKYLNGFDDTVQVVVAAVDIEERTLISEDMLETIWIGYEESVRFFSHSESDMRNIVGNIANEKIPKQYVFKKEDPVLVKKMESITTVDNAINDPYFIDNNDRITLIVLPKADSVGKMLKKGHFIDVIFTSTESKTGGIYSSVILQHVLVYDMTEKNESIEVYIKTTLENCAKLSLARETGKIHLILNPLNGSTQDIRPIVPSHFFNYKEE